MIEKVDYISAIEKRTLRRTYTKDAIASEKKA